MPDYRGAQECYWLFAPETNGGANGRRMLEPAATILPAAPTQMFSAGYSSMPTVNANNAPVPIMSLGSYRLLDTWMLGNQLLFCAPLRGEFPMIPEFSDGVAVSVRAAL